MSVVPEEATAGRATDVLPRPTGELTCLGSIRVSRNRVFFDVTARPQAADLAVKIDQLADCIGRLKSSDPIASSLLLDRFELVASNVGRVAAPASTMSMRALGPISPLPRPVGSQSWTEPA